MTSFSKNMTMTLNQTPSEQSSAPQPLKWWQRDQLEKQGCSATDWRLVAVSPRVNLLNIRNVRFSGSIVIEEGAIVRDIPGGISNCHIGRHAIVENVARIEYESEAPCGVGVAVSVLDETGSRPVVIYPGLSAQIATLMARVPKWLDNNLRPSIQEFLDSKAVTPGIGDNAVVRDCGILTNVSVGAGVKVEGAQFLKNGAIINNAAPGKELAFVGSGVNAANFIIEDGRVDAGCIVRNCYVGQGVTLEKGFSAHDSLFFANCSFENGEACALFAGPYTVSMHKGTLLIGCQTAFMNAGSSTNQSNHMYKLGPVHWGVLERGVKTASGAYLMFGAKIGPFSMVMGPHKTHPDSSPFPFSYLFGDERGATVVVPGAMLRSCGLLRDEQKWPTRDRRLKRRLPLFDRVVFNVLNPFTVDSMLKALDTISELLARPADDDLYLRYKGMKFTRAALERAKTLYTAAIFKYLSMALPEPVIPPSDGKPAGEWVDVGGQIMPREFLDKALATESIPEAEEVFSAAFDRYVELEREWIGRRFGDAWRRKEDMIAAGARQFDDMVEDDRQEYLDNLSRETRMLSL